MGTSRGLSRSISRALRRRGCRAAPREQALPVPVGELRGVEEGVEIGFFQGIPEGAFSCCAVLPA
jgi:hypothetical protein